MINHQRVANLIKTNLQQSEQLATKALRRKDIDHIFKECKWFWNVTYKPVLSVIYGNI